jgi:cytochrome c-type biogenesis protein
MSEAPGFFLALGAGILSFLSPCVLPLIPGYVSSSPAAAPGFRLGAGAASAVFGRTLAFVLGFTAVFTAWE